MFTKGSGDIFKYQKVNRTEFHLRLRNQRDQKNKHVDPFNQRPPQEKSRWGGDKRKGGKRGSFSCGLFLWSTGRGPGYGSCPSLCVRETESPTWRRKGVRLHPSFTPTTPYRYIHTNLHAAAEAAAAVAKYERGPAFIAKIALASQTV